MMNKQSKRKTKMWRGVILSFATFFCVGLILSSCKKKKSPIGSSALPPGSTMHSKKVDTFTINTYTVRDNEVPTGDPAYNILGSYIDPVFGKIEASFYTQLTLSGFSPDFGNMAQLHVDSAVMAFEFGGAYGEAKKQNFEIYELAADLSIDSSYTASSTVAIKPQNIVAAGKGIITPDLNSPALVGGDSLDPELRIPIDTNFAKQLLGLAHNSASDEDFLNAFKGLYFKVDNSFLMDGGSMLYLATSRPSSKLTVYYHNATDTNSFDFIVTGDAVDFNHLETHFSGTKVGQVLADSTLGNTEYYAQALSTRARVLMPTLDSLPKDIIIHSAKLELPVAHYPEGDLVPSSKVIVSSKLFPGDDHKYLISQVSYNSFKHAYIIDLRTYIQNVLNGKIENNGLFISPKNFISSAERIRLNGVNTTYKKKPKLTIVYTRF